MTIPHTHGLLGHSDADVLLHAVTDALLGAAGLGDIGRHFPDTDPAFRAPTAALLREAMARVRQAGWTPVNIDATVHAQAPKIGPHAAAMVANIAADTGLAVTEVNIKAKTNEGLGYLGRKEGIAAICRRCWRARIPRHSGTRDKRHSQRFPRFVGFDTSLTNE